MPLNRDSEYLGTSHGTADYAASQNTAPGTLDPRYGGGGGNPAYPNQPGGYDPTQSGAPHQQAQRIKFNQEEMRALRECNKESFYYRCLPIGTALGVGAYYGVRYGYLKPSARFGAGPKMFFASVVGYFIGKFSYQRHCAEKLMALPNSQIGEMLRKQKGRMGFQETLSMEPGFATAAPVGGPAFSNSEFGQARHANTYSDVGDTRPLSSFDSEGGSGFSGYDSNYDTTQQILDDENLPPKRPQSFTSYDDLRRQNRIDYESKQHSRNPGPPPPSGTGGLDTPPSLSGGYERPRQPSSFAPTDAGGKGRNKYGDVWDDKPGNY